MNKIDSELFEKFDKLVHQTFNKKLKILKFSKTN